MHNAREPGNPASTGPTVAVEGRSEGRYGSQGRHALLAGGGTGGHVFPALAVAQELLQRGWRVSFAGQARGLEARIVAQRGVDFYPLAARPVVGRALTRQVAALGVLGRGALQARALIRRLGIEVVLGTGGFVSAPAVVGARLARRRVILLEPNAQAGAANRWLSRLAHGACVAYDETPAAFHCPTWVTGVPVRREFFAADEGAFPAPDPRRILVLGGSQGAAQLNELLPEVVARLARTFPHLEVLHQAGGSWVKATRSAYDERLRGARTTAHAVERPSVDVVSFIDDVPRAMAHAHLIISRAGAVTLAEVCASSRPAVLLPLRLAGAHQYKNAQALARAGAAVLARPEEQGGEPLAGLVEKLLRDLDGLRAMGQKARHLARPDAARAIAGRLAGEEAEP